MALRTFIGTCCTLLSSVVNLTVLTVLKGEPGWICLLACNADGKTPPLALAYVFLYQRSNPHHSPLLRPRPPLGHRRR